MADRLLWVDGFQTTEALSSLLMCSAAFLAPFDEQSPTSVNLLIGSHSSKGGGLRDHMPSRQSADYNCGFQMKPQAYSVFLFWNGYVRLEHATVYCREHC